MICQPCTARSRSPGSPDGRMCWGEYVGLDGAYVCLDRFGESAPAGKLFEKYGFTPENVAAVAEGVLKK